MGEEKGKKRRNYRPVFEVSGKSKKEESVHLSQFVGREKRIRRKRKVRRI